MATIISFNKKEKLAMLKIMIEINNYYTERLPKAFEVIQEFAILLDLDDGISEANAMPISTAKKILNKSFEENFDKDTFFIDLLGYMFNTSDYGLIGKMKSLYEFDDKILERLTKKFRKEWRYASELFGEINLELLGLNNKDILISFLFSRDNPMKNGRYFMKSTVLKSEITKRKTEASSESFKACANLETTLTSVENSNKKTNLDFIKKELTDIVRKEIKNELKKGLDLVRKELKDELQKEVQMIIHEELGKSLQNNLKSFVRNNFNDTLYKDL